MEQAIPTTPIFWIIIGGYFVLILGFGSYFAKYNKNTNDFFFSGRRFSWWLITMSIVATGVGSHSFLKYSAKAFEHGFSSTMTYMNDWFFYHSSYLAGYPSFITPVFDQSPIILRDVLIEMCAFWQQ